MNLFSGVTVNWGFDAADIFTNGMFLVVAVAGFVLLGIAIKYVPVMIHLLRVAANFEQATGRKLSLKEKFEDFGSAVQDRKYRRRG